MDILKCDPEKKKKKKLLGQIEESTKKILAE
jgi:hypothetical protein